MICTNCEKEINDGAEKCKYCGTYFEYCKKSDELSIKNFIVKSGKKLIDIFVGIEIVLAILLSIFAGIKLPIVGFILALPILLMFIVASNYIIYLLIDIADNIKIMVNSKK